MAWVQCGGKTYKLATVNSNPVAKQCIAEQNKVKQVKHQACMEQPTCKAEFEAKQDLNLIVAGGTFLFISLLVGFLISTFVKAVSGDIYLKDGEVHIHKKDLN